MIRFIQTLPVTLAAVTCALFAVIVDYVAGPRVSVFDLVANSFSVLDLTSILMSLWALTLAASLSFRQPLQRHALDGFFLVAPSLFGLGAATTEIFAMLDGARMFGDEAGAQIFMLYERRLVVALAFLAATIFGSTVQLATASPHSRAGMI